jgi:hypothetical protein
MARRLVRSYPTHEFVIDRTEAFRLGLKAHPLSAYPEAERVVAALSKARRSGTPTLALDEVAPLPDPQRWREDHEADGQPGASYTPPNLRGGGYDGPELPRPGQMLHGRRRHAAVADAAGYAQGPRRGRDDATLPRWQPEEHHAHRDVDLDDSWIWGLAPRPVHGHGREHGDPDVAWRKSVPHADTRYIIDTRRSIRQGLTQPRPIEESKGQR